MTRPVQRPMLPLTRPFQRRPRQRGMAVIAALLVVMAATLLVAGLLNRQAGDARTLENTLQATQARTLLRAGIDWAALVLRNDGRRSAITHNGQLWAVPVEDTQLSREDSLDVAVFSGRIEDAQGKFNLYNLARDGVPDPAARQRLQRLLSWLGLPDNLASGLTDAVAQSQASGTGENQQLAQRPLPLQLEDFSDINGLTPEAIEQLAPHVTMLPVATELNVNTATPLALAASIEGLDPVHARALVQQRDQGQYFRDRADFINRLNLPDPPSASTGLTTHSQWFLVKGAVTLGRAVITTQALLHRPGQALPDTIWTRERP